MTFCCCSIREMATYQKLDADSKISKELVLENMQPFPEGFSLKNLQEDMEKEKDTRTACMELYRPYMHVRMHGFTERA